MIGIRRLCAAAVMAVALLVAVAAPPGASAQEAVAVTMMPVQGVVADGQPRGINFVVTLANGMLAADASISEAGVPG